MAGARASIYTSYAPIYDAIGQGRFAERMAVWALGWLARRGAAPARVLDLACGTGAAALAFAAAGCATVGVDRSPAMLDIARARARGAGLDSAFVRGDIRRNLRAAAAPGSVDLACCFYDSLNYLTGDGDLGRAFAAAAAALRPGGFLIGDLNMLAEYDTWDERDTVPCDSQGYLVYNQLQYDPELRLATGRIVWFVRETELWWRGEETHTQRAWADAEISAALAGAGLEIVARLDSAGEPIGRAPDEVPRVVYVAQRPA